ncbi:hypothetical protein [Acetoanaerobium noterae]|uniref:hypothetical protein n=1 Tax=Acetoanaerobium noterae TaxID=745369 RepID=UPI0028A683A5|nr:hypothetical protein [Acetoanaerobium noterae]
MVHQLLVKMYASNIITYGNRNFGTIPENYVQPVKEYTALNYTDWQIDNALVQGYITEQEYTEIMTLKNTK